MRLIEQLLEKDDLFCGMLRPVRRGYETKCWEWKGAVWSNGYPRRGPRRLHRYAYELIYGKIEYGLFALHKCDNKLCCRPDHIYAGTHSQNMLDYKERGVIDHSCENSAKAVLDNADVGVMRWLSKDLHFSTGLLRDMFGVSKNTVLRITQYKSWKRVSPLDLRKSEFKDFLCRKLDTGCRLSRVSSAGFPNFRDEKDEYMAAAMSYVVGDTQASRVLGISRNSIRNAERKFKSSFDYSISKSFRRKDLIPHKQKKDWFKWRKRYAQVLDMITELSEHPGPNR